MSVKQLLAGTLLLFLSANALIGQRFHDFADSLGVHAMPDSHYLGSGVTVYDFDEDGWDDLSFPMPFDSCLFYRNDGGTFTQTPHFIDGYGETKHIVWVDYDNDGDHDLALSTFEGQYKLFNNDGEFNFTDVSVQAGLLQGVERYYGMCFGDYDRDGDLDFYATCYNPASFEQTFSRLNHLYRNNGDGTFTNVTEEAGVGDGWRLSFQAVWFDYDQDGWPDLLVINDHSFENSLYKNNGDGTFTDVSEAAGIQFDGHNPMTITVGDFDNDGDLDVYTTNTYAFQKRAMLWVNNGDGTFINQSQQLGVDVFAWTWGALWLDMDNDTDQDLFVATGHISSNVETNDNYLFESFEGLFFEDVTHAELQGQDNRRSYGVGRGDFNNDGYADIAVTNRYPFNANLWQNSGGENHYIKMTLAGTVSNSKGIGSWIRVFIGGQQYTQYTLCGENYIGQDSQHRIFGTGDATVVDSVQVEYVSGHTDRYYNLPVDTHYYFTEGETYTAHITPDGTISFCEDEEEVVLDAGAHEAYLWNNGHNGRYLSVQTAGEYWVTVQNQAGITANSDTVMVQIFSSPYIQPEVESPQCHGEANGSIVLENLIDVPLVSAYWDDGQTGTERYGVSAGTFGYTATDANGCQAAGSVTVFEPMPLSVLVFTFPPSNGDDGAISLIINGGTPPYTIQFDGEPASDAIEGLESGVYEVTVADANDCQFSETVFLGATGLQEGGASVQVFPNPVDAILYIQQTTPIRSAVVSAMDGREVLSIGRGTITALDVSALARGPYQLEVVDTDGTAFSLTFLKR